MSILGHVEHDDRLLLQKYAGQRLLGRNLIQRILVLDGEGGASKGAFGWSPIPANVVHRQLDDILLELFAVSKSNSIPRHGKQVRGYRNLKFRLPTDEDPF
jgi:hypothetical protein